MRKLFSAAPIVAFVLACMPAGVLALGKASMSQGGGISGVARSADKQPLPNYTVRVRSVNTGQIAGTTSSNQAGEFSFTSLTPGNYVVEIVDAAGKLVGVSQSIAVAAGAMVSVSVSASAAGALTAAAGGGFSLFGLGSLASVAVIGAAGAISTAAVIATRGEASPSR